MQTVSLGRPAEALFEPAHVQPMDADAGWRQRIELLRANPLATLPDRLFRETYHSGPFMGRQVHYVSGPEEVRSILHENFMSWGKSPLIMRMLKPILGDAVFVAHGDSWKRQRKTVQPTFLKRRLDRFVPLMVEAAELAIAQLDHDGKPIEIHALLNEVTFFIIERALFSTSSGLDRGALREAFEILLAEIGNVRFSDLIPAPQWVPRLMAPRVRRALGVFRRAAEDQINRRRAVADPCTDLLGLLLSVRDEDTGEGLSDTDIRDTLITFVAAGHETTAVALTWAFYLVANDPACQAGVRAEAETVFGAGAPDADQAGQLHLARQVVEEALRLYPPAPMLGRRALEDTQIAGRKVRKGDMVLLAFYALHRHPEFWDHPDRFDPDRWNPDRRPNNRYLSMAFGGGPRACVGAQFAMMETSIILSMVLSRLTVMPTHGKVEPVMQVTLRPKGGMPLRFERHAA
ncbi:cytochrome P450 [Maricaulaceae bacterium EIL42A08]|nr:cytochrome P450 [Maricaulaceae bacterium EIL42A08]